MGIVPLAELLQDARAGGYAVGYFEAWDGYSFEAAVEAAEAERAPVVLGFGCAMVDRSWLEAGGIEQLAGIGRAAAERAQVPAALLLNEAHDYDQAVRGLEAGFNAVMVATHAWPAAEALETVRRLVAASRRHDAAVEAELGALPAAVDGRIDDSAASLTDPEEAAAFVAETGADCLAVSIGNVHLLTGRTAPVDLDRLEAVHRRVPVPLAIHGGSSFPPEAVEPAVARGVAKVNVGTVLKQAFLEGVREAAARAADPHRALGSRGDGDLLVAGKKRMRETVRELIRLYGGSGRA